MIRELTHLASLTMIRRSLMVKSAVASLEVSNCEPTRIVVSSSRMIRSLLSARIKPEQSESDKDLTHAAACSRRQLRIGCGWYSRSLTRPEKVVRFLRFERACIVFNACPGIHVQ